MLRTRIIPTLLLHNRALVKTKRFGKYRYIGDPANTVRIFNELEVDELCVLDISSARTRRAPDYQMLGNLASECFMPLAYGGGIINLEMAKRIFDIGYEKVIINTSASENPEIISEIANVYGSQAVVASIDVGRDWMRRRRVFVRGGRKKTQQDPVVWAKSLEERGAGEILLTSMINEGTYCGFDLELLKKVSSAVGVPVISNGGAGKMVHIREAVEAGASAVALGSMVVFQKKDMGVLVNFPTADELMSTLANLDAD